MSKATLKILPGRLAICILFLASASAGFASANLLTNGDFETGTFAGWTTTPAATGSNFGVSALPPAHDTLGAFFSASGSGLDSISQTFATTPGALYDFSFFYQPVSTVPPNNHFIAFFNGVNLYENADTNSGFITLTFTNLLATGITTTVEFDARSATGTDFLDDVSVTAAVPDAGTTLSLFGLSLTGLGFLRRKLC